MKVNDDIEPLAYMLVLGNNCYIFELFCFFVVFSGFLVVLDRVNNDEFTMITFAFDHSRLQQPPQF